MTGGRERTHRGMRAQRRLRGIAGAVATLISLTTAPAAMGQPAPRPVNPGRAMQITRELAAKAPRLPRSIAATIEARTGRRPAAELRVKFARAIDHYLATGRTMDGSPAHHHDEWNKNGLGCYAQGFDEQGVLVHADEHDMNANGKIDPWELDPNRNETCREVVLFAYNQKDHDRGSFTLEFRTETDGRTGKVYKRTAGRWNYVVDDPGGHHDGMCSPTAAEWRNAMSYVEQSRKALERYVNNPMLAWQDGFRPYPVPATKTFHWFNTARWDDGKTLDPNAIEMFVAAVTDDGWRPVNISPIYHYKGADPVQFNPNQDVEAKQNNGSGCLVQWHRHLEGSMGAEGAATGNIEGRDWMGHLWLYGGLFPFGDKDVDCSEPHGWFMPLNNAPALCNSVGTGI